MEAEGVSLVPSNSKLTHDGGTALSRKEKRKGRKKVKRSEKRQQAAEHARQEDEYSLQYDPSFLEEKAQTLEKERLDHELQLRLWLQREKEAEEEADRKRQEAAEAVVEDDENDWDYVEDGPAEIIWEGNEIIVRKQKVKVPKAHRKRVEAAEDDHPVSNPLLPESLYHSSVSKPLPSQNAAFEDHKKLSNSEHNPNFGTEQDKTHCPFHIKTGVCRFGVNCSRAHVSILVTPIWKSGATFTFEAGSSMTELMVIHAKYTDEEVLQNYEEFFDDVHGEFSKHGEIVNFKVCRNESSHLRGNVYVQFQSVDSALTAYSALNGRFYALKQITCEFVVVTRWRAALCGEYMRSHHKVCSHGTACNFLHCFKNPCGLYDWADWDNPPPRSFSAAGRRSRVNLKEDKDNHKHHGHSHRRRREEFSSKRRRSHQCDDNRVSRERKYEGRRSNDSSCEESLSVDRDHLQKEWRHRSSKKRYEGRHSSSEESLSVERDGFRDGRRHRSSEKSREEDGRTKRKEDARKQRHRSRSQDRHERKRYHGGIFHDGSRTRGVVDKRNVVRRERRSRSSEGSKSDGGTPCEVRQEKKHDSYERYRPRSRSLSPDSLEQSPEDEVVFRRTESRSSSDRRKRRRS